MSIQPARKNYSIWHDTTWRKRWALRTGGAGSPLYNLTGYTATFEITDQTTGDVLDLLTVGDGIALGGAAGTIDVVLTTSQTSGDLWERANYELRIISASNDEDALLYGTLTIRGNPG